MTRSKKDVCSQEFDKFFRNYTAVQEDKKNKWFQENSKDVLQKIKITPNALDLFISKTYVQQQMPMICKKKSSQKTKKK